MITKIFIVEDHPIVRQVLSSLIDKQSDLCVCGEADSVQSALDKIPTSQADLVLIDISLPSGSGLHLLESLHKQLPDLKSLVVSGFEKAAFAQRALELGARLCGEGQHGDVARSHSCGDGGRYL
jgi:DNA-binding NarL/FixJ family response regulator